METGGAPWWVAGSLFAGALAMKAIDFMLSRRKDRAETDANIALIESLRIEVDRMNARMREAEAAHERRMLAAEEAMAQFRARLDEETKGRMGWQEVAHKTRLRVAQLESTLRQIGANIPPEDP